MNNYPFYPNNGDSPGFNPFSDPLPTEFTPMSPTPSRPSSPGGPTPSFPARPPSHGGPMPFPPGGPPSHGGPMPFPPGGPPSHGGPMPFPPGGPPSHGGQTPQPMGPPPHFTPAIPTWQPGPGGIRSCLYRNTYVWMRDGSNFWYFPTFVMRNFVYGFRWGRFGWIYHIINSNNIRSFQCF